MSAWPACDDDAVTMKMEGDHCACGSSECNGKFVELDERIILVVEGGGDEGGGKEDGNDYELEENGGGAGNLNSNLNLKLAAFVFIARIVYEMTKF